MSEKNDGTGGIAALASWLMMTTLLSTGFVTTIMPSIADSATKVFDKIANPFISILAGVIGSLLFTTDLRIQSFWLAVILQRQALRSNYRRCCFNPCICSITVCMCIAFRCSCSYRCNRWSWRSRRRYLCIPEPSVNPTGLHHALNNVFWFDTIGLETSHFWNGGHQGCFMEPRNVRNQVSSHVWCLVFLVLHLPWLSVQKTAKKKAAIGILASATICAFICGVARAFRVCIYVPCSYSLCDLCFTL